MMRQKDGKSLASQIQQYQRRVGMEGKRLEMILSDEEGNTFAFTDVLYYDVLLEVPGEDSDPFNFRDRRGC